MNRLRLKFLVDFMNLGDANRLQFVTHKVCYFRKKITFLWQSQH